MTKRSHALRRDLGQGCPRYRASVGLPLGQRGHARPRPGDAQGIARSGADNWRVLLSIADAYGEGWGERARLAALIMARGYRDEDIVVTLLGHIREIFEAHPVDRIASAVLVGALLDLEDAPWAEWRGVKDDQPPRRLTQATLASLLKGFHIRPRSIWPAGRTADKKPQGVLPGPLRGRLAAYCPRDGTPAHANVFKLLHDD